MAIIYITLFLHCLTQVLNNDLRRILLALNKANHPAFKLEVFCPIMPENHIHSLAGRSPYLKLLGSKFASEEAKALFESIAENANTKISAFVSEALYQYEQFPKQKRNLLRSLDNLTRAVVAKQQIVESKPYTAERLMRARVRLNLGTLSGNSEAVKRWYLSRALSDLIQIIQHEPLVPAGYLVLGHTLVLMGKFSNANLIMGKLLEVIDARTKSTQIVDNEQLDFRAQCQAHVAYESEYFSHTRPIDFFEQWRDGTMDYQKSLAGQALEMECIQDIVIASKILLQSFQNRCLKFKRYGLLKKCRNCDRNKKECQKSRVTSQENFKSFVQTKIKYVKYLEQQSHQADILSNFQSRLEEDFCSSGDTSTREKVDRANQALSIMIGQNLDKPLGNFLKVASKDSTKGWKSNFSNLVNEFVCKSLKAQSSEGILLAFGRSKGYVCSDNTAQMILSQIKTLNEADDVGRKSWSQPVEMIRRTAKSPKGQVQPRDGKTSSSFLQDRKGQIQKRDLKVLYLTLILGRSRQNLQLLLDDQVLVSLVLKVADRLLSDPSLGQVQLQAARVAAMPPNDVGNFQPLGRRAPAKFLETTIFTVVVQLIRSDSSSDEAKRLLKDKILPSMRCYMKLQVEEVTIFLYYCPKFFKNFKQMSDVWLFATL